MYRRNSFSRFARAASRAVGHPVAFLMASLVVVLWAFTGPVFHYSDTWQLVINTGTTVVTFLIVFLIQNTQNRDSHTIQLKLDELIRAVKGAHTALLDIEELSDAELNAIHRHYDELAAKAREALRRGGKDTGSPNINFES